MIPEQIYHKYGPTEYTELWKYMTAEEVNEFTEHVCLQCIELGGDRGRFISHRSCNYLTHHGKTRRCSPFACLEVGYFSPKRKMNGAKDAYLDAMRDYVSTWVDKMRERKAMRDSEPNQKPNTIRGSSVE